LHFEPRYLGYYRASRLCAFALNFPGGVP